LPNYESVFIARQDITAAQVEGLVETFEKVIMDAGGSVPKKESWGLRTLAYKIKKNRKGHYTLMNIDAPAGAIHEMERQMRINEDVLRYITLRVDEFEEGPSVMMRSRDRDDRSRRGRDDRGDREPRRDGPPKEAAAEDKPAAPPAEPEEQNGGDNA
jgi:small subunit ribosomal protein S6